ncbi:hypothetical protein AB205_0219170, partial [Aquarana catesbeiana]
MGEFECRSGECVNASRSLCDGRPDCRDFSDEDGCGTVVTPGLVIPPADVTFPPGHSTAPGSTLHPGSSLPAHAGEPGIYQPSQPTGSPGIQQETPGQGTGPRLETTGQPGIQEKPFVSGKPGIRIPDRPEHRLESTTLEFGDVSSASPGMLMTTAPTKMTDETSSSIPPIAAITHSGEAISGGPGVRPGPFQTGVPGLAGKNTWSTDVDGTSGHTSFPALSVGQEVPGMGTPHTRDGGSVTPAWVGTGHPGLSVQPSSLPGQAQ